MSERRIPSDTQPIDAAELARALDESTPPQERETGRECPDCGAVPRSPSCITCTGEGWVTYRLWLLWVEAHGSSALVTCPQCCGDGRIVAFRGGGRWYAVRCTLCDGACRVRGNFAAAYERERASLRQ